MKLPFDNPHIAIDLDGTILESGHYPEFGPPQKGVKRALARLQEMGFKILIWTARTNQTNIDGSYQDIAAIIGDIKTHLKKHRIPFDTIVPTLNKPFVFRFIDDRAIKHEDWDKSIKHIEAELNNMNIPLEGDKKRYLKKLIL